MPAQSSERGDQTSTSQQSSSRRVSGRRPGAEIKLFKNCTLHSGDSKIYFFFDFSLLFTNADEFVPERNYNGRSQGSRANHVSNFSFVQNMNLIIILINLKEDV